eukprot:1576399-Rhodomonas_salina.2
MRQGDTIHQYRTGPRDVPDTTTRQAIGRQVPYGGARAHRGAGRRSPQSAPPPRPAHVWVREGQDPTWASGFFMGQDSA